MTLEHIKKLADKAGIDIEGSILSLPIERQQEIAKQLGYDNFEEYVHDRIAGFVETKEFLEEDDSEPLTLREYLDQQPLDQRYHAAGWCGRVYMGDASQLEVLQKAGYSQDEIDEIVKSQTVA